MACRGCKAAQTDAESRFTTNAGGSKLRMTKPFVAYDSQRHRLLGLLNGSPIFAVETLTEGEVHDFREVGFQLTDNERDIAATAAALTHWHRMEPQCPRCGRATVVTNGGFARHCAACGQDHFPRTDPAVIVAVVDADDRLLLGGQPTWGNRVSVLAGFCKRRVIEQAIHRNRRRGHISLSDLRYFGSQPRLSAFADGCVLRAGGRNHLNIDTREIAHAEWHTRDQPAPKLDSALALPGRSSIALRMIEGLA